MNHSKRTLDIYLNIFDSSPEYKLKHLYSAQKEVRNRINNPLKDQLNSDEKFLLDYIQVKIDESKKELKKQEKDSGKSNSNGTIFDRSKDWAVPFLKNLKAGKFSTSDEVAEALKDVAPDGWEPSVNTKFIKKDEKPHKENILFALASIYASYNNGKEVSHDNFRKGGFTRYW